MSKRDVRLLLEDILESAALINTNTTNIHVHQFVTDWIETYIEEKS
jgi:uncharacterized protein with HEPN domain